MIMQELLLPPFKKIDRFISKYKDHPIYNKHLVIVFDECHRSQFGDMHTAIVKSFKKYHLFGFTALLFLQPMQAVKTST